MKRRHFLRTAAASAAPLVLYPKALMAAPRSELSFIVVTDTHVGYEQKEAAEQLWHRTAESIAKQPGTFVLHLGDVVDNGHAEQYPKYLAARKLIGKPVHEIPGNHDPVEDFKKHIRQEIDTAVEHDWLRVLMINNAHRDSHDGFITAGQIEWLSQQCEIAMQKDQLILFAMHVPVHTNEKPDRGWYVKPAVGQTAFYDLMKRHQSRVVALFHGHFHYGLRGWDDHAPVHEVSFPSALWNADPHLDQRLWRATTPSSFARASPALRYVTTPSSCASRTSTKAS